MTREESPELKGTVIPRGGCTGEPRGKINSTISKREWRVGRCQNEGKSEHSRMGRTRKIGEGKAGKLHEREGNFRTGPSIQMVTDINRREKSLRRGGEVAAGRQRLGGNDRAYPWRQGGGEFFCFPKGARK